MRVYHHPCSNQLLALFPMRVSFYCSLTVVSLFSEEIVRILQQNGGGAPGVSPALGIVLLAVFVSIAILLTGVILVALFVADSDEQSPNSASPSQHHHPYSRMLSESRQIALESLV